MHQVSPIVSIFASLHVPRQTWKVKHSLVDTLVIAACSTLAGADNFQDIELWAEQRLDWFRHFLPLKNGIPSHDIFGRLFGLICPEQFESAFRLWVAEASGTFTFAASSRGLFTLQYLPFRQC